MELWEAGIPSFSVKNAMPRADKCFAKTKPQASSRQIPIQLDDLMGAFFILGIGLSLATSLSSWKSLLKSKKSDVDATTRRLSLRNEHINMLLIRNNQQGRSGLPFSLFKQNIVL